MKSKAIKNVLTTVGLPVLFGALIFALWQTKVLHTLFGTDEIILPLPTRIQKSASFYENSAIA